jgi:RNA polymerase subunit RPABC4/transcription elongation factor Spt4
VLTEVMHGIDWRVWAVVECDICARSDARRSSYLRRGTWPACRSTSYLEAWSGQIVVKEPSNEDAQCSERDSTNGLRCPGHIGVAMESGRKKDRRSMLIGSFIQTGGILETCKFYCQVVSAWEMYSIRH